MIERSVGPAVVAIVGPTAVGKTAITHAVARAVGGEIIVADPFQRYIGLEIAADTPSADDLREVPHHMVRDLDLAATSTVADFARQAHGIIDEIRDRGRVPIVSGGSGLYVRAALTDMDFPGDPPEDVRDAVEALVTTDLPAARDELRRLMPDVAERVDGDNPRRVARALALARIGVRLPTSDRLWSGATRRPTAIIGLTRPREVLHRHIALRVDRELADGLVAELRAARARPDLSRAAAQIIGMREVGRLDAREITEDELRELLIVRTRRLARSQDTWIRKTPGIHAVEMGDDPPEAHVGAVLDAVAT